MKRPACTTRSSRPSRARRARQAPHGFTLIELMIVVAVIAVLGAIAIPNYTEYIRRGHRADARAGLLQAQQWLERAATASGVYPTTLPAALTWSGDNSKRYTIGFQQGNTNASFTLVATRRAGSAQAQDRCGDFTLTHTGKRDLSNSQASVAECWNR